MSGGGSCNGEGIHITYVVWCLCRMLFLKYELFYFCSEPTKLASVSRYRKQASLNPQHNY